MIMPSRNANDGSGYSYGFQGQEKDDEIKGEGNSVNYKYRMHDVRTGRFFAVDPLAGQYPHNSPYAFSENVVIDHIELEGLEKVSIKDEAAKKYLNYDFTKWTGLKNESPQQVKKFYELSEHASGVALMILGLNPFKGVNLNKGPKGEKRPTISSGAGVVNDFDVTWNVNVVYEGSNGNLAFSRVPVAKLDDRDDLGKNLGYYETKLLSWDQISNYYTNCFADALGCVGYMSYSDMKSMLNSDYTQVDFNKVKIGDVAVFGTDHAMTLVGKNEKGQWLYNSNFMGDERMENVTFEEVMEMQLLPQSDDKLKGTKETDFKFYSKKND